MHPFLQQVGRPQVQLSLHPSPLTSHLGTTTSLIPADDQDEEIAEDLEPVSNFAKFMYKRFIHCINMNTMQ